MKKYTLILICILSLSTVACGKKEDKIQVQEQLSETYPDLTNEEAEESKRPMLGRIT